jgi:hypothetical protein
VPEEHGALKHKVPTSADYSPGQADVPRAFREYDDSVTSSLLDIPPANITAAEADKGKLLIVQSTGAPAFEAMKGDATLAEDGTLTVGKEKITLEKLAKSLGLPESYLAEAVQAKLNDERVPLDGSATSRKVKLTSGIVSASGNLTLTEAYIDVPGALLEITPAVASVLHVIVSVRRRSGAGPISATLKLDSEADMTVNAQIGEATGAWQEASAAQIFEIPLSAAAHTIKLRAKRASPTAAELYGTHTRFSYELVAA